MTFQRTGDKLRIWIFHLTIVVVLQKKGARLRHLVAEKINGHGNFVIGAGDNHLQGLVRLLHSESIVVVVESNFQLFWTHSSLVSCVMLFTFDDDVCSLIT